MTSAASSTDRHGRRRRHFAACWPGIRFTHPAVLEYFAGAWTVGAENYHPSYPRLFFSPRQHPVASTTLNRALSGVFRGGLCDES